MSGWTLPNHQGRPPNLPARQEPVSTSTPGLVATQRHVRVQSGREVQPPRSSCRVGNAHLFPALSSHRFLRLWDSLSPKASCVRAHPSAQPGTSQVHTCFAAILEDPTMFPLLSKTSIPSSSSVCLIRTTLQILALAADEKSTMISNAALVNTKWQASVRRDSPSALLASICQEVSASQGAALLPRQKCDS